MNPSIIISGYDTILQLAQKILQETEIPQGVKVKLIHSHEFFQRNAAPKVGPSDILVCGHQTSVALQQIYSIKSIPIKITGFELLRAISEAIVFSREITIVNFYADIPEIDQYASLLNIKLHQVAYSYPEHLTELLVKLKEQGCKVVIGSSLVCDQAEKYGIKSIFIYSLEGVREALKFAVQMISAYLQETERAETFKSIVDYTYTGIIGLDRISRVSTFNPAAEKMLGLKAQAVIGKKIEDIFPDMKLQEEDGHILPRVNQLGNYGKKPLIFSSVPIKVNNQYYGQVTVLQDADTIRKAEEKIRRDLHQKRFVTQYTFKDIAGGSEVLRRTIDKARMFAMSDSAVLIAGETGTGKELVAQGIHDSSSRRSRPFVSINCGALTESLLDSELFGYERGSFTGAKAEGKTGLFEMAHTGTIFLDEVEEILPSVQVRLLRVLQEKEVMRIGGDRLIPIDVRIIAATNQDLWRLVQAGKFRQDLYYRLNVLELQLPPLREHLEDIPDLVRSMLVKKAPSLQYVFTGSFADFFQILQGYSWPGNIRELENIVERFSVLVQNVKPDADAYIRILRDCFTVRSSLPGQVKNSPHPPLNKVAAVNPEDILRTLEDLDGNKSTAAKKLGISRTTLYRKMKKQNSAAADVEQEAPKI
ncbi:MAG: sigma 54-interacting transcriptional regulator [Deltaproteobacteria bacterium]